MKHNPILQTDSYKLSHWPQYPAGTTKIYSYLESRGGKFPATLFNGLQPILKEYLSKPITMAHIDHAHKVANAHFQKDIFNLELWRYILEKYDGFIPLNIMAVPEGTLVENHNVLMTMENTDDDCAPITNHFETKLMKVWAPITVATNSFYCKRRIRESALKTGSPLENVPFKLHDFGYRGVSSEESAGILGAAHLINFMGTDTLAAIEFITEYYNPKGMPGFSIPASEHSTATPYGLTDEGEKKYMLNMLNQYPEGLFAWVIDSRNTFNFCKMAGTDPEIKDRIMSRNGTVVFRPDSGDPVEVVNRVMDILWECFGGTYTDNHYKLLDPHVRVIQGDGIDYDMLCLLCTMMESRGYASDNLAFGSGGGLLQKFDRDTQKFAIKCSYAVIYGKSVDVLKNPATGSGKQSKPGRLKLHHTASGFKTFSSANETPAMFNGYVDSLVNVFNNGKILKEYNFEEIRNRANSFL